MVLKLLEKHFSAWENIRDTLSTRKAGGNFGTQAVKLMPYDTKTWQMKLNVGLMIRNFYQSDVIFAFTLLVTQVD